MHMCMEGFLHRRHSTTLKTNRRHSSNLTYSNLLVLSGKVLSGGVLSSKD